MELWIQILVAFIAVTPGVLALVSQRKKTDADASSVQVQTSINLLNEVQEQLKELKTEYRALKISNCDQEHRIKELENQNVYLHNLIKYYLEGISRLTKQIEEHGDVPVWKPNK